MDHMEEGELPSSSEDESNTMPPQRSHNLAEREIHFDDNILDDSSYVIIERPRSSLPMRTDSSSRPTTASSNSSSQQLQAPQNAHAHSTQQPNVSNFGIAGSINDSSNYENYEMFGKKGYYNKAGVSDLLESSDKDSSSESDSDEDNVSSKRSRMVMPTGHWDQFQGFNGGATASGFGGSSLTTSSSLPNLQTINDTASLQQQEALNDFYAQASKFQKERKPNLVWANVLQEEEISKGLGHQVRVGHGHAEVEVTRGPETYFFLRPQRQPRQRRASDSSDISSEGLSDNALHYLKDGIDDEETEESSEHSLPTSFKSSSGSNRKTNKRRRTSQKHKRKIVNKLKKMKSPELAKYMASKLHEEKVTLLARAIETLGKDSCIHVFLKTLKIEKRGGIMIKSNERRRTAGGVFFYLIRGDKRFPKSAIDNIFREDRAFHDKFRKKKVASKRLRKKGELEAFKAASEQGVMKLGDDLSESQSDYTAVPEVENDLEDLDGTDTGQFGDDSTQESSAHSRDTEELGSLMDTQYDGSEL